MPHVVGATAEALKPFTDRVNAAEGLPKPPAYGPPGQPTTWTPSPEQPEPPPGWTVRYYAPPTRLVDGRFAILGVQDKHLPLLEGLDLDQVETVTPAPISGGGSELG